MDFRRIKFGGDMVEVWYEKDHPKVMLDSVEGYDIDELTEHQVSVINDLILESEAEEHEEKMNGTYYDHDD
jgi:hypothetical protein